MNDKIIPLREDESRAAMKDAVAAHRAALLRLREGMTVDAYFNGVVWPGQIKAIRKFTYALPDFRLRFDDKSLIWVSGAQIVLPQGE